MGTGRDRRSGGIVLRNGQELPHKPRDTARRQQGCLMGKLVLARQAGTRLATVEVVGKRKFLSLDRIAAIRRAGRSLVDCQTITMTSMRVRTLDQDSRKEVGQSQPPAVSSQAIAHTEE